MAKFRIYNDWQLNTDRFRESQSPEKSRNNDGGSLFLLIFCGCAALVIKLYDIGMIHLMRKINCIIMVVYRLVGVGLTLMLMVAAIVIVMFCQMNMRCCRLHCQECSNEHKQQRVI